MNTRRMILVLEILVYLVIVMNLINGVAISLGEQPISLLIDGELWSRKLQDLAWEDAAVIHGVVWISQLVWISTVWQIKGVCRSFRRGEIFSREVAVLLKRFAMGLIAVAILSAVTVPFVGLYLVAAGVIPQFPDISAFDFGETEILMVGVFFFVIAWIQEMGAEMKNDVDLTI